MSEEEIDDKQADEDNDVENIKDDLESGGDSKEEVKDHQDLPRGSALTMEEAYKITSYKEVKFILLAGKSNSGKSTLVTTLYHMFNLGPFAGHWFAGSETLLGFEQRAFNLRTASFKSDPDMPKTRVGILDSILHLRLFDSRRKTDKDLLITDLSGEDYGRVIGNVDAAKSEYEISKRADFVVVLIDGKLLSQKTSRNRAEQESLQLLQTFLDAKLVGKNSRVDIVISKYDLILLSLKEDPSLNQFINNLKTKFKSRFESCLRNLRFLDIAAMPENSVDHVEAGYGLEDLISYWMVDEYEDVRSQPLILSNNQSQFDLFTNRFIYD